MLQWDFAFLLAAWELSRISRKIQEHYKYSKTWTGKLALPPTRYVTLGRQLRLSEPEHLLL